MINSKPNERDIVSSVSELLRSYPLSMGRSPKTVEGGEVPDTPNTIEDREFWQNLGRIVHYRILNEYANSDLEPPGVDIDKIRESDETNEYIEGAINRWEETPIEIWEASLVEETVWVPYHGKYLKGRLDLYGKIDGYHGVLDITLSPVLRRFHALKLASYAYGLRDDDYPVERGYLVSVCPDPIRAGGMPKTRILSDDQMSYIMKEFP